MTLIRRIRTNRNPLNVHAFCLGYSDIQSRKNQTRSVCIYSFSSPILLLCNDCGSRCTRRAFDCTSNQQGKQSPGFTEIDCVKSNWDTTILSCILRFRLSVLFSARYAAWPILETVKSRRPVGASRHLFCFFQPAGLGYTAPEIALVP